MSAPLPARHARRFRKSEVLSQLSNAVTSVLSGSPGGSESLSQAAARTASRFARNGVEFLEPRQLFTTLVGGEIFEYATQDPTNPGSTITNRIVLSGNVVAELIGGSLVDSVNPNGGVNIADVPGRFFQSPIGRGGSNFLGGVGGGGAVSPVVSPAQGGSVLSVVSQAPFSPSGNVPAGSTTGFNLRATAVNPVDGQIYGLNVVSLEAPAVNLGTFRIVQLVRITGNRADVIAELNTGLLNDSPTANSNFINTNGIESVTAADFSPVDGRLYFVVRGFDRGTQGGVTGLPTQQLFSVDVNASTAQARTTSVTPTNGSFGRGPGFDTIINSIVFDRVGTVQTAYAFGVVQNGAAAQGVLFGVNFGDTDTFNNQVLVTAGGAGLTGVTGLAIINDDPAVADTTLFAVESKATGTSIGTLAVDPAAGDPRVLTIDRTTGAATSLGRIPATAGGTGTGANLQSLTYLPSVQNPFTGQNGVLFAIDNTTKEAVFVDSRSRPSNLSAMSLYISQSDSTASIVIGTVANFDPANPTVARPMQPFTGTAGTLKVQNANGPGLIDITSPAGIGSAFLGLKTFGDTATVNNRNNIPVIAGRLATALGVRPAGDVASGIISSPTLLQALNNNITLSQRLLGQNVTDVQSVLVQPNGTILAIDTDGIGTNGASGNADELVVIDRNTGTVSQTFNIFRPDQPGTVIRNNRGMVLDNQQRILAIFLQQVTGQLTNQGNPNIPGLTSDQNFRNLDPSRISLSISGAGPTGFILVEIDDPAGDRKLLYSFSAQPGATTVTFSPLGALTDADGNTIHAARALGIDNTPAGGGAAQLYTVGFSAGNPNPTQSTGGTTLNLNGIDPTSLTYAADGNIYLVSRGQTGVQIRQVQRDQVTGQVLGLGAPAVITSGGGSIQNLDAVAPLVTTGGTALVGIGSSSISLLPTQSAGQLTDSNAATNFSYRGLARLAQDQVFAVTFNGSTLNLRRASVLSGNPLVTAPNGFNVVPTTPRTTPANIRGNDIRYNANPASGRGATTAVIGIRDVAARPGDANAVWGVGYTADQLLPTDVVLGDLGTVDVRQIQFAEFRPSYSTQVTTFPANGQAGTSYPITQYLSATRGTATTGITLAVPVGVGIQYVGTRFPTPATLDIGTAVTTGVGDVEVLIPNTVSVANGLAESEAFAVDRFGNNAYLLSPGGLFEGQVITSGFNIDSPVPAAPIPGSLGQAFGFEPQFGLSNVRALAFGNTTTNAAINGLQDAYALVFNGLGTDIYRMTRSTVTGGITGFTKVSTQLNGLIDPANGQVIQDAYMLVRDPTTPNRFYTAGTSQPTALGSPQRLYELTITPGGVTVNTSVDLALTNVAVKAGAIDAAGNLFIAVHNEGANPNFFVPLAPITQLYRVDPTSGQLVDNYGAMVRASRGSGVPTGTGAWTTQNSHIRAMQFHLDSDGTERLLALDNGPQGTSLVEYNFANIKNRAQLNPGSPASPGTPAVPGGVPANISGLTGTRLAAVGISSDLNGMVSDDFVTFAIDQYGRGYSVVPGSGATADRIFVSPNEVYVTESGPFDLDGDNVTGETIRMGWLLNPDGTAFTDTFTTMTSDIGGTRLIGVVENRVESSLRPASPLFGRERLVSLSLSTGFNGGTGAGTVGAPIVGGAQTFLQVTPIGQPGQVNPTGEIRINTNGIDPTTGTPSDIAGLGFDITNSLVGLDRTTGNLVAFGLNAALTTDLFRTGNPTLNTLSLTDLASRPANVNPTADPRGYAFDILGRGYTVDGTTIGVGLTQLLVSRNEVSAFRIDTTTGVAQKMFDLADAFENQQVPILTSFGGIAFRNANTIFLVQKDLRNSPNFGATIDRLVSLTIPAVISGPVPFTRFNAANTGGAIRIGNATPFPGTPTGTATNISALTFTATDRLLALDDVTDAILEIDVSGGPTDTLSPTNATFATPQGSAGNLAGLEAFGTQLISVNVVGTDSLVFSANDLSLYQIDAVTGTAILRQLNITESNVAQGSVVLTDTRPVVALAARPTPGVGAQSVLLYAVFRDVAAGADFLYTVDVNTGIATSLGQIRLAFDAAGSPISTAARVSSMSFGGVYTNGVPELLAIHDPNPGSGTRQIIRINLTTPGQSVVVRGSTPGAVSDSALGFASDSINLGANARTSTTEVGRFYTLDLSNPAAARLRVTPTQFYRVPVSTAAAATAVNPPRFTPVAALEAPVGGLAVFEDIRSIAVQPGSNQIYGVSQARDGSTTLVTFPLGLTPVVRNGIPTLVLAGGQPIQVTSSAAVTIPVNAGAAVVTDLFFIGSELRGVDRADPLRPRIIRINIADPVNSVALTAPGTPDAAYTAYSSNGPTVFAIDPTGVLARLIRDDDGLGDFPSSNDGNVVIPTNPVGTPVLGFLDGPTSATPGAFRPINTGQSIIGAIDPTISDIKAMAYEAATNSVLIIDQNNRLVRISPTSGRILTDPAGPRGVIGIVRDAVSNQLVNVGSMAFDLSTGRLLAQDTTNARLVDISLDTALAGGVVSTASGSLSPTVGAIAYDPAVLGGRIIAVDNATGSGTRVVGQGGVSAPAGSSQLSQIPLTLSVGNQDIGELYVGGTIAGSIKLTGSVRTLYAGWIVTGNANGIRSSSANALPGNFSITGNLEQLITAGPIGTAGIADDIGQVQYLTGADIQVGGRLGVVRTLGDFSGSVRAAGANIRTTLTSTSVFELESIATSEGDDDGPGYQFQGTGPGGAGGAGSGFRTIPGSTFTTAPIIPLAGLRNETLAGAQRLYATANPDGTTSGAITVYGVLENVDGILDALDSYTVPMLAGQSFTVQLVPDGTSLPVNFGVFDPDGRLVFSSHTTNEVANPSGAFRITADRPGEYRIAVAVNGDYNFNGTVADPYEDNVFGLANRPYFLTVTGLGQLTVGAVVASGTILDNSPFLANTTVLQFSTVYAATGDIGAVSAARIMSYVNATANTVRTDAGSIRSVSAGSIGEDRNNAVGRGASISSAVDIGLIRSTSGVLSLNSNIELDPVFGLQLTSIRRGTSSITNFNPNLIRVGGSIQAIDAATSFSGNVVTNRGIGNIRAGDMNVRVPSLFNVNADNIGNDGIIDFVDVTGQLGTLTFGGPIFNTNAGGNIRYLRAGGPIFRDPAFGGGSINEIFLDPGAPLNFVDDSGATINIGFDQRTLTPNPAFDSSIPGSLRFLNAPSIAYRTYPIRSGGAALMDLEIDGLGFTVTGVATGNVNPANINQLSITSSGAGSGVEIGNLFLSGTDNAVTITGSTLLNGEGPSTFTQTGTVTTTPSYRVSVTGPVRVDIARLQISDPSTTALGNVSTFTNSTGGELLDFSALNIGTLAYSGNIGVARPGSSGAAVLPNFTGEANGNLYPFTEQPYLIRVGNVIRLSSAGQIGNIIATNIDQLVANANGADDPSVGTEGIVAPVISTGVINTLSIGEGVLPAGTGEVGGGIVVASGRIDRVIGTSDVRGIIASQSQIGTISIGGNGALIGAGIHVYAPSGRPRGPYFDLAPINNSNINNIAVFDLVRPGTTISNPTLEIGAISVAGGIIGTDFTVNDLGGLSAGGFGLLRSSISSAGGGRINNITAAGYGIRGTAINAGSSIGKITATGNGSQLSTASVTPSVRRSEFESIDSFFGFGTSPFLDIHAYLATSAAQPVIANVTNTGVIEDSIFTGNRDLGAIRAWQIRGSTPGTTNTVLNFANNIGSITTTSLINGLTVTTGRLTTFAPASDVLALDLNVSGPVNSFVIKGNLASNSKVNVTGPGASINNFDVRGNFDGSLNVSGRVNRINVGGNLTTGTITVNPAAPRGNSVNTINLGGSLSGASLNITGNVGTITAQNSLGTSNSETVTVTGNLGTLNVGQNRRGSGRVMAVNLSVGGSINTINVRGRMTGAVTAAGSIRNIRVQSDGDANRTLIAGNIRSTTGDIGNVTVTGGDIGANINAFNRVTAISVSRGSVLSGSTIATTVGNISRVSVTGGNYLGSILAGDSPASGRRAITNLSVDGQLGGGTTPTTIQAASIGTARVGRTVFSNTTIDAQGGPINSLTVGGDIQANATIRASEIRRLKVSGTNNGTITRG